VSFASASIDYLSWGFRVFPETVNLSNTSFKRINVTKYVALTSGDRSEKSADVTKWFLENATFSEPAFTAYETQLRSSGLVQEADHVFFSMHEHRRALDWTWAKWPKATLDYVQEYVLGYGRSPTHPLLWSIVFIVVGFFVFTNRGAMEPKTEKPAAFSPLWYSLELFLPVVDLGVAKDWRPRPSPTWRVAYARLHQIAGWVLVPVALAAVTGVFK
jgi:hypothetical protein